jgi:hypothetical protein
LLPFLLFRNDAFSILLTVAAISLAMSGRNSMSLIAAVAGILSKIWTAVLSPIYWRRGRRADGVVLLGVAAFGLAINFSPSVQSIQQVGGLHTETLAGSVVGLFRALRGVDLDITGAATAYIDAPGWTLGFNLVIGALVGTVALKSLMSDGGWRSAWPFVGAMTVAGVLASPFFSTQYVAWFAPFTAFGRRSTFQMLAVSTMSLVLILSWFELFEGSVWWWGLLLARNVLITFLGFELARAANRFDEVESIHAEVMSNELSG